MLLENLFFKDSKNQYRGIHFLDEKFVVSYRFFDQSMVDRKIEYELSGTDIIRFDPKNISSSYRFLYRKDLRLSGGSQCNIIESKEKLISQLKKKFSSNFTKQQIIIKKTTILILVLIFCYSKLFLQI